MTLKVGDRVKIVSSTDIPKDFNEAPNVGRTGMITSIEGHRPMYYVHHIPYFVTELQKLPKPGEQLLLFEL